jgi:hypothetical protein
MNLNPYVPDAAMTAFQTVLLLLNSISNRHTSNQSHVADPLRFSPPASADSQKVSANRKNCRAFALDAERTQAEHPFVVVRRQDATKRGA